MVSPADIKRSGVVGKLGRVLRDEGLIGVMRRVAALVYRRGIWPLLPTTGHYYCAGIRVAIPRKVGDRYVPDSWRPRWARDRPGYESALVGGIRDHVCQGDDVVVVGGGMGVTTCIAAMATGNDGSVRCYEGSAENVEVARKTADLNGVSRWVAVHHAVVARPVSVWGDFDEADRIRPSELPECDVLELDCEGAELDILDGIRIRPRVILVETHGLFGAPTREVRTRLGDLGYAVADLGVAESAARSFCEEHDIRVLSAVRTEADAT